jgi:hypothetical protein
MRTHHGKHWRTDETKFFFVFFIIMLRTEDEINILWRTNENVFFCITYHYVKN